MAKYKLDKVDIELLKEDPIGRAYLEYNEKVGGERLPREALYDSSLDVDGKYGGELGLYVECVKQGKTWEKLLGISGDYDIPEEK